MLLGAASFGALLCAAGLAHAQEAGSTPLQEINVEGRGAGGGDPTEGDGKGAVDGLVARQSTAGSKTATPIIETPQSLTVIGRDRLDTFQSQTVNEAVRYTPGISPDVYGSDTRSDNYLSIRGLSANFYQDGLQVPLTPPYSSWRVDPWSLERVEVLRGPASILFGQGSPGGTVNYVSKRPTGESRSVVETGVGSDNRVQLAFDHMGASQDGVWSYRLAGLGSRTDLKGGDPFNGERVMLSPSFSWKPNDRTSFTLFLNYLKEDTSIDTNFLPARGTVLFNPNGEIARNRWTGARDFDRYRKEQASVGYEFEHKLTDVWTVRQNLRYWDIKTDIKTVFGGGFDSLNFPGQATGVATITRGAVAGDPHAERFQVDNQAEAKFELGPTQHTMLFGVDYSNQDYHDKQTFDIIPGFNLYNGMSGNIGNIPLTPSQDLRQNIEQTGFYVQDQIKIWNKLVLLGGLRYDKADTKVTDFNINEAPKESEWSPRVGAVYLFDNGLAPYVSYSQSFLPNVGKDQNGDAIKPSIGEQKEAGVRFQPPGTKHSFSAAAFEVEATNSPTTLNPVTTFIQDLRSRGVELEALLQFDSGFRTIASYTKQNVDVMRAPGDAAAIGRSPVAVPDQIAQLWGDYTIQSGELKGLRFGAGVRWNGESNGGDHTTRNGPKAFKVPDFALFDAGVSYERGNWRFAVNADNLADKKYVTACAGESACYYGPGRKILATVRYTW